MLRDMPFTDNTTTIPLGGIEGKVRRTLDCPVSAAYEGLSLPAREAMVKGRIAKRRLQWITLRTARNQHLLRGCSQH